MTAPVSAEELKPCPFCGGEAQAMVAPCGYLVECGECNSRTDYRDDRHEAIAAWNRRATAPSGAKVPDKIQSMLLELRQYRDAAEYPLRSGFNAACDRLDVLASKLATAPVPPDPG